MPWRRTAAVLGTLGVGLLAIGLLVGRPELGIEGAFFTRDSGTPAYSSAFEHFGPGLASPHDGNLWLGAGLAWCLAALVILVIGLRTDRPPAD